MFCMFVCFFFISFQDINLDLVQFPQPVYITEVRIIPLGARVQADFPGGVRLGATNPSKFHIHLFVNDLSKPGASSFENLGDFEYNQNDCISLQCTAERSPTTRQIPTDGLAIRGCYTTITLAIYGLLAKDEITSQPISSPTPPVLAADDAATARTNDDKNDENALNNIVPIDLSQVSGEHDPKGTPDHASNDTHAEAGIGPTKSNSTESTQRKYTEEWVAKTGNNDDANALAIDAKSPDADNWNADDDLNKTATSITTISSVNSLSPDSQKRKREASPEYRFHRGVLDKKISKTKEYVASRASPTTPTSRSARASTPDFTSTPTLSESRRPRTPESLMSDEMGRLTKAAQSPSAATAAETPDNANVTISSLGPNEQDDDMSQGKITEFCF